MTKRSEMAIIAYTLAVVLFAFVQVIHNVYDTDAVAPAQPRPATPVMMVSTGAPRV